MAEQKSIPVTIPATTAHRQFGELIRRAFSGKEHFIVEKDGLPVVVILSMAEYQEFQRERAQRQERLRKFEESARTIGAEAERKGISEDDVAARVEATRQRLYDDTTDMH